MVLAGEKKEMEKEMGKLGKESDDRRRKEEVILLRYLHRNFPLLFVKEI